MATSTSIEWVRGDDGAKGLSWNALRAEREIVRNGEVVTVSAHHCEHVNEACRFCYAGDLNRRLGGLPFKPGHRKDYRFVVDEEKLIAPLKRRKPTRIFVESMSDAFGEWWPREFQDKLYAVMALSPQHTYINLSKRPAERKAYLDDPDTPGRIAEEAYAIAVNYSGGGPDIIQLVAPGPKAADPLTLRSWPLPNVIEGTSVSNQEEADAFIPILLATKPALRIVSAEPLLGPIDFTRICLLPQKPGAIRAGIHIDALRGRYCESGLPYIGEWDVRGPAPTKAPALKLDGIIVGGESGPKARPMHPQWARDIRDQCEAAGVPFFFKQFGEFGPNVFGINDTWPPARLGKKAAGRLLDGRTHDAFPEVRR